MLVRVHACFSQDGDVPLKLLDLVQIVNESLGNLFDQQRAVRDIELDLRFDGVVTSLKVAHLASGLLLGVAPFFGKGLRVRDESGRAFDSLLETVLLDVSLHLVLEILLLFGLFVFHVLSALFDSSVVLSGRSGLLNLLVTGGATSSGGVHTLLGQGRVDNLVLLIHVASQFGGGPRLVKFKRNGLRGVLRFLKHLHLGDEGFLNSAEVWHGAGSHRLEREAGFVLFCDLSGLKVFLLLTLLLVDLSLHAREQLRVAVTDLGILADALLSFVFVTLHHHAEARNQDAPWDVASAELVQHTLVDVVHVQSTVTGLLVVTLVEGERLSEGLVTGK